MADADRIPDTTLALLEQLWDQLPDEWVFSVQGMDRKGVTIRVDIPGDNDPLTLLPVGDAMRAALVSFGALIRNLRHEREVPRG